MKRLALILILMSPAIAGLCSEDVPQSDSLQPTTAAYVSIDPETIRQLYVMIAHIKAAKQAMEHLRCLRANGNDPFPCFPFQPQPLPGPIDVDAFAHMDFADQESALEALNFAGHAMLDELVMEVNGLYDELR